MVQARLDVSHVNDFADPDLEVYCHGPLFWLLACIDSSFWY